MSPPDCLVKYTILYRDIVVKLNCTHFYIFGLEEFLFKMVVLWYGSYKFY